MATNPKRSPGYEVPELRTPRLLLRPLAASDVQDVWAYASRPEVTRYTIFDYHRSQVETKRWLSMVLRSYKLGAPPTWAIQLRVTSRVIGSIGMRNINEEHHHAEFGYALTPEFWNQGYATEAVRAVLAHGLRHMNLNRMEAKVVPEHTASRRVLEKAGMHLEGILRQIEYFKGAYHDLAIYSMLRSDLDEKR